MDAWVDGVSSQSGIIAPQRADGTHSRHDTVVTRAQLKADERIVVIIATPTL